MASQSQKSGSAFIQAGAFIWRNTVIPYVPETEFDLCELCDLEIQGHDPETDRLPLGLWESYIPGFNLIAVILELSHRNLCLQTHGQTDGQTDSTMT